MITHAASQPTIAADRRAPSRPRRRPVPRARAGGHPASADQDQRRPRAADDHARSRAPRRSVTSSPRPAACRPEHDTSATDPHRSDVAAAHDRQRPLAVPARAEAVDGVGQPVQVQRPGAERPATATTDQTDDQRRPVGRDGEPADRGRPRTASGQHRQRRHDHGPAGDRRGRSPAAGRTGMTVKRADGQPQRRRQDHRRRRPAAGRPAAPSPRSSSAAERSTGTAASAPLPSPSRSPRSSSGSSPSLSRASCWAGSVERCPAAHQAITPGCQVLGDRRLGHRDDAVQQHRYAGAGPPSSRNPTPAARSADAERGQPLDRVADRGRRPGRSAVADHRGLVRQRVVVDPGARGRSPRRPPARRWRRSARPPGWCCRCPCRRRSAGRRRRRSPLGRRSARAGSRRTGLGRRQRVLAVDRLRRTPDLWSPSPRPAGRSVGVDAEIEHPQATRRAAGPARWPRPRPARRPAPSPRSPRGGRPTRRRGVTPWSPASTTARTRSSGRGGQPPWQAGHPGRRGPPAGPALRSAWPERRAAAGPGPRSRGRTVVIIDSADERAGQTRPAAGGRARGSAGATNSASDDAEHRPQGELGDEAGGRGTRTAPWPGSRSGTSL